MLASAANVQQPTVGGIMTDLGKKNVQSFIENIIYVSITYFLLPQNTMWFTNYKLSSNHNISDKPG